MRIKSPRVLVSAYACNPEGSLQLHPGEDLTGWKIVEQLGLRFDVWVITHSYNRRGIEAASPQDKPSQVKFIYVDLPSWLRWLYRIEFAQRIYYYLWQIKAWRVAAALHTAVRFDAAQHVTFGNYWIGSFIGAFLPVPFIWGPVGGGQRTPPGLLKEYSFYGVMAERFRAGAQWIGLHILLSRRLCLKRAKTILVCNYETKNNIPVKYADKVRLFPVNGISQEDLKAPDGSRSGRDKFRVIATGRFVRLKGFGLAIRAFFHFIKDAPDAEFEIIGNGPEERRLKTLARDLGIQERVLFRGWLPRSEVLAHMRQADVFLFPSFRDGGGAVVAEAMASGLPVIVIASGGPGFYVEAPWGIKVEPRDPESTVREMAAALATLHRDRKLLAKMGTAGRARAENYFLWDKLGERLNAIYQEALGQEGSRGSDGPRC